MDLAEVQRTYPHVKPEEQPLLCLRAVWIVTLLHHGYNFPMDTRQIHFMEHDVGQQGAML